MNQIRDDDPDLAAHHFDRRRAYSVGNEFGRQNQVPSGYRATPTLKYESYRRFRADVRNGRIEQAIEVVIYDPENWEETPFREKRDPKRYMSLFARLARAHGYYVITSPARDLVSVRYALCHQQSGESLDDAFLRCRIPAAAARHANAYEVQAQVHEDDPAAYSRFVSRSRRQARRANPRVVVLSNLATSPGDYVATAEMLWSAHEAVDSLVVGHQLNINTSELPIAKNFLRMMRTSGKAVVGKWSAPFTVPTKGIHASVLPTGEVLWFSYPVAEIGSDVWLWDPRTGSTTNASLTTQRDVFCVAQSFLADGRILMTGGHVYGAGHGFGVKDTDFFDPSTREWTEGPDLSVERWYPTNLELGNGKILVFGGQKDRQTTSDTVESYDPATNTLTTLPSTATKKVNSYPRLHLLPSGRIALTNQRRTQLFNPSTNTWSPGALMNYGGRGASDNSVLLPGLTKVLEFGGKTSAATSATNTAEIIDFAAVTPQWRYTAPMSFPRMYANPVVLPDGKVLVVGGGRGPGLFDNPVTKAELFDPVTETWSVMAPQVAPRIYHSTAVLLPDGRVVSAGQDKGSYQFTAEIYSPPYLFKGPRPQIDQAPAQVGYGEAFTISTPDPSTIERVALVRPPSVTHSVNFDQRYVDLSFTVGGGSILVSSPPNGNHAPPGPYMLFLVSSSGVPSVASWVTVGDSSGPASFFERVLADGPAG